MYFYFKKLAVNDLQTIIFIISKYCCKLMVYKNGINTNI